MKRIVTDSFKYCKLQLSQLMHAILANLMMLIVSKAILTYMFVTPSGNIASILKQYSYNYTPLYSC